MLFIGLILAALTLPGTIELLLLTIGAVWASAKPKQLSISSKKLRCATIIPAHNEEKDIAATLQSLQACPEIGELIVIADNCTDSTASIARAKGVRVLERNNDAQRGKNYALDYAFTVLKSEGFDAFLVVDADTVVEPNFFKEMDRALSKGVQAVQVRYGVLHPEQSTRTRLMHIAFMAFNHLRPLGRSAWGFSAGILGNGFALTSAVLEKVPYRVHSVVEDLAYHIQLVEAGFCVAYCGQTKVLSEMPSAGPGVDTQRVRWEGGRFAVMKEQAPILLRKILSGQWRLIEPLLDLLLLPLGYHVLLLLFMLPFLFSWALLCLSIVAFHVLTAMILGGARRQDYQALLFSPFYLIWKLCAFGKILKALKKGLYWGRTERQ